MQRILSSLLACSLALPLVHAAPARLPYEQALRGNHDPHNLKNSSWYGSDIESGDWEITFEASGAITYSYNGRTFRNGTWKCLGSILYFETNDRFYEFRGSIEGNAIDGESWNAKGLRWHTSMYRLPTARSKTQEADSR
jgi:hypothetical protein